MYEYLDEKTEGRTIGVKWVFFNKGKLYDEATKNYGVNHGLKEENFKKIGEAKKEEPVKEVIKEEVVKKAIEKKISKKTGK